MKLTWQRGLCQKMASLKTRKPCLILFLGPPTLTAYSTSFYPVVASSLYTWSKPGMSRSLLIPLLSSSFFFLNSAVWQCVWCPLGLPWLLCKTQNSGLPSKEEKPLDPINQSSRCNAQEGLLSVAQTGWLWSPGRQSTPNSKLGELLWAKKTHY